MLSYLNRIIFLIVLIISAAGHAFYTPINWESDNQTISSDEWKKPDEPYYPNFTYNPALTDRMKRLMAPYLLPIDHPARGAMGVIFSRPGVIKNDASVKSAGFKILHKQPKSHICVLKHPLLKGYLLKVYLDCEKRIPRGMSAWKRLTMRCIVAEKVKSVIEKRGITNFIVADKWVYPIPTEQVLKGQPVVLLVKDMQIFNSGGSAKAWRSRATRQTIRELFEIFRRGYGSAFLVGNLPYTHSGRFAFIDTEFGKRRLPMVRLSRYFSPSMRKYWLSLLKASKTSYRANSRKDLQE